MSRRKGNNTRAGLRAAYAEAVKWAGMRNACDGHAREIVMRRGGGMPTAICVHGTPGYEWMANSLREKGCQIRVLRRFPKLVAP